MEEAERKLAEEKKHYADALREEADRETREAEGMGD